MNATDQQVLLDLLSATSLRARVLAGNVANQNVPGYQRRDVEFEDMLSREAHRQGADLSRVEPKIVVDTHTPAGADGNNVVMEQEMGAMRENRLRFELFASILAGRVGLMQSAIHGDR